MEANVSAGELPPLSEKEVPSTLIYLCLTFGARFSPSEYAPWGVAVGDSHRAHSPVDAARDGPEAFCSLVLVDDGVLVDVDTPEALIAMGSRP